MWIFQISTRSKDYIFGQFPIVNIITRDRFEKLLEYFHANDRTQYNRNDPSQGKGFLVPPTFTIVADKCLEAYLPHKGCSVDEAMIAFRGRLGFRQYMSAKPTKYGIKLWVCTDSRYGFLNEFHAYVGKPPGERTRNRTWKKIILKLTRNLRVKIIMFSSITILTIWNFKRSFLQGDFLVVVQCEVTPNICQYLCYQTRVNAVNHQK